MRPPRPALLVLAALVAVAGCRADAPGGVADDLGRAVDLDATPRSVLPLAPNVTELVVAAAGADRLAGVAVADDFPPAVTGLPRFQSYPLDTEAVVALDPDLAVGSDDVNPTDQADGLAALGVPTYLFAFDEVADVPRALRTLDTLLASSGGAAAAAAFEDRVRAVERAVRSYSRPRVLLLVGDESLYAFGRDSHASELVRLAGGDNVTDAFPGRAAQPSEEAILEAAPEVVVVLGGADYDAERLFEKHPAFLDLPAVRSGRVYGLDADLVSRAGPRLAEGLERLARLLHPEAFAAGAA
ncbi:ABC transporter substrate-binding protein [Rubrivirga sp. S365]|uniref:ABC transporter substrate-binding protein n=1 Tax=Rubrivirga litoralis TaxID=3075598 RepID=A0ABU3BRG6_9BACT|nr:MULTISPECIES: ABC transporter substrate-binding protein [unclassified Rubrivirga]MDT0631885.1 ABC transporter substrate-binding protein [Rubrivirga sp. F394]MDT7857938.1 ABC transporter substrate-binding protein [Rubrivirga sp. S365]